MSSIQESCRSCSLELLHTVDLWEPYISSCIAWLHMLSHFCSFVLQTTTSCFPDRFTDWTTRANFTSSRVQWWFIEQSGNHNQLIDWLNIISLLVNLCVCVFKGGVERGMVRASSHLTTDLVTKSFRDSAPFLFTCVSNTKSQESSDARGSFHMQQDPLRPHIQCWGRGSWKGRKRREEEGVSVLTPLRLFSPSPVGS